MRTRDVSENELIKEFPGVLEILLFDHSSKKNIIWATSDYQKKYGNGYSENDEITIDLISGEKVGIIEPRINKSLDSQKGRSKDKAEVFTPAKVCSEQNNLVDSNWFSIDEFENGKFTFCKGKNWNDYVSDSRLEMACGEAPYICNRYDVTTGDLISLDLRKGILDRKLRVINENINDINAWKEYAIIAVKAVYGFEFQGDNLLLARENVLYDVIEYFESKFGATPELSFVLEISNIISWNFWQMDGLKLVIPNSCHDEIFPTLFGDSDPEKCPGCLNEDVFRHNGIRCLIMDWDKNEPIEFISLVRERF